MAITVAGVSFGYPGGETLFFDVSFRVHTGSHMGLIGDNATGKSTLLKLIAGIYATRGRRGLSGWIDAVHAAVDRPAGRSGDGPRVPGIALGPTGGGDRPQTARAESANSLDANRGDRDGTR